MTFSTYQYDLEYRYGHYDRYVAEKYQSHYCVPKIVKGHKSVPKIVKGENSVPNFSITHRMLIPHHFENISCANYQLSKK